MHDVRYALRIARQNPGSTLAAFIALTLGIGATTAIFSVLSSVILRPLPVRDPNRVLRIFESDSRQAHDTVNMEDYLDWKRRLRSFESLALSSGDSPTNFTEHGAPERVLTMHCDSELLRLLGVQPVRGRNFFPEEDQPGKDRVALLSWAFWQSRFSTQDVLGKKILLDDNPHTIVGVLPRNFSVLEDADIFVPVVFDGTQLQNTRGYHRYSAFGRLRTGVSIAQANAELAAVARSLASAYPRQNAGVGAHAIRLRDAINGGIRPVLLMLFCAVLCVLLIACGNVANLLLARASSREREIAVRIAIGASWLRLARQLLIESILLSCCAAVAGLGVAALGIRVVSHLPNTRIPHPEELSLDWRTLLFTVAAGVCTGVLFGLAPVFRVSGANANESLKQSGGKVTETRRQQRLRQLFVFAETALAAFLLIQGGLLFKSFVKASHVDAGFDTRDLITMFVSLPRPRYDSAAYPGKITRFAEQVIEHVRSLAGIKAAAVSSDLPIMNTGGGRTILVEGQARSSNIWQSPFVQRTEITPGYFGALGIPVLQGRDFNERDSRGTKPVLIVNQAFVRRFLGNANPIGKRIGSTAVTPDWAAIVGVVGNVRQVGIEQQVLPEMFVPLAQEERLPWVAVVARTKGDPLSFIQPIEKAVHKVDPELAVFLPRSMNQIFHRELDWRAFHTSLLAVFSAIAIVLASIGIYAVIAYSVTQRTSEIGVRMALGAESNHIVHMIVRQWVMPALLGAMAGVLCSVAVSPLVSGLLYEVQPTDLTTYILVVAGMLAVSIGAAYLPARRAASIDPADAVRHQ